MSSSHFAEGLDNQKTREFVETYQAEYKQLPGIFAAEGFTGGPWLAHALQKIEGKAEDTDALIATLIAEEVEGSPLGDIISLDSYGNPVFDVYVRKVAKQARSEERRVGREGSAGATAGQEEKEWRASGRG